MGFNPRLAPYSLVQVMDNDANAADEYFTLFRFPVAGRVLDAWACDSAGIAASTDTLALMLMQFSTAATPLVVGTLGSWAAGTTWVADTPRQMAMTSVGSTAQFTAGQYIRLFYDEAATGQWTEMNIQIDYVLGYDV